MVPVQWLSGGFSLLGVGLQGPFGVDRYLYGGGRYLVVGGVVGLSAWWVMLPSHALVVFAHGALWPDGVGWWAVVVVVVGSVLVLVLVVVVVMVASGALVAVMVVLGSVVVLVLWLCP